MQEKNEVTGMFSLRKARKAGIMDMAFYLLTKSGFLSTMGF
jgi:hypothetical protein